MFYRPYPAYIARGEGSHIWDVDGNERIDNFFNATVLICGHNHPTIMKAVEKQLACGTSLGGPTEAEVKLAEILVERWPSAEMVRFTSSGSEAILQACRVARSYTGKEKIAKFEGSYHGCWDAVDISVSPPLENAGPPRNPNSVRQHEGIPEGVLRNTIIMPYNNAEAVK
ncbi:MAG: aminotransferase class III-fold pyridoxal phosphate-dependent enzyme, partial [Candidatus Bathyarchaeia archaeon]